MFIKARHWTLSWTSWIQSKALHSISLKLILILCSRKYPSVLSGDYLSAFWTTMSNICRVPCVLHVTLILLTKLWSSWWCLVHSTIMKPWKIQFSAAFCHFVSLKLECFPHNRGLIQPHSVFRRLRAQVSHSYKTVNYIMAVCVFHELRCFALWVVNSVVKADLCCQT